MADWPKYCYLRGGESAMPPLDSDSETEAVPVIPADLGRELYEALEQAMAIFGGDDESVWEPTAKDALARYEREVGNESS